MPPVSEGVEAWRLGAWSSAVTLAGGRQPGACPRSPGPFKSEGVERQTMRLQVGWERQGLSPGGVEEEAERGKKACRLQGPRVYLEPKWLRYLCGFTEPHRGVVRGAKWVGPDALAGTGLSLRAGWGTAVHPQTPQAPPAAPTTNKQRNNRRREQGQEQQQ